MLDPSFVISELISSLKGLWGHFTDPELVPVFLLNDIEQDRIYIELKKHGCELHWSRKERLRQLSREGWEPVVDRTKTGRPQIFVDRLYELILLYRRPAGKN